MPFLPSLLEYTPQDLETKLKLICADKESFLRYQKSEDGKIYLHLDFVLSEFALSRNVGHGNIESTVFDLIEKYFADDQLYLSIHLMGLEKDLEFSFDFLLDKLSNYVFEYDWVGEIFVARDFVDEFKTIEECSNFKVGEWLDLGEWNKETKFETNENYLLMTVVAGKSGQKLLEEDKNLMFEIANTYPESIFTVDGGWNLELEPKENLKIVSYSSFWKGFEALN
jgi:hypothetical protein